MLTLRSVQRQTTVTTPHPNPPGDDSGGDESAELVLSIEGPTSIAAGERIALRYTFKNIGNASLSTIRISNRASNEVACQSSLLSPGYEIVCNGEYILTESDLQAGQYRFSAVATATGLPAEINATTSVNLSGAANNGGNDGGSNNSGSGSGSDGAIPLLGLTRVSDDQWDTTAVSKVLQVFAWGGHVLPIQVEMWADMAPDMAISQILNFDPHNWRISTRLDDEVDNLYNVSNTLGGLSDFWSSSVDANKMPWDQRPYYKRDGSTHMLWTAAGLVRGLNPFHHKIGMWETNYHMAVNLESQVNTHQLIRYYDVIMESHRQGLPYQDVINNAALSAAVATQYMHRRNRWKDGECLCNEDFAREYFQLFFGILGTGDTEYHETVTIKNMARALTDIQVKWDNTTYRLPDLSTFGTSYHYPDPLPYFAPHDRGI